MDEDSELEPGDDPDVNEKPRIVIDIDDEPGSEDAAESDPGLVDEPVPDRSGFSRRLPSFSRPSGLRLQAILLAAATFLVLVFVSLSTVYAVASWTSILPDPEAGVAGVAGSEGERGDRGKVGLRGEPGRPGLSGPRGPRGSQGPDGIFCQNGFPNSEISLCP
jgi:hypothetical protein